MGKLSARELQQAGWKRASKSFSVELMKSAAGVNRNAQQILINATSQFLDYVQINKELLPIFTANLHDSIATSVSQSGRILRANYMPVEATRPQTAPGRKRIVGEEEAAKAVRSYRPMQTGVHATLFVAVPYAEGANKNSHHPGYYDWLEESFKGQIESAVKVLESYPNAKAPSYSPKRF